MGERTDPLNPSELEPSDATPKTEAIRQDIERTQREISQTVDRIQYRLSPQHVMEQTRDSIRRAGVKTKDRFVDKVKANPIPAAMVGVGLWLLMRDNDKGADVRHYGDFESDADRYGYGYDALGASYGNSSFDRTNYGRYGTTDRGRSNPNDLGGGARDKMHEAREKVGDVVDSARDKASHLMDSAREKTDDFRESASEFVDEAEERAQRLGRTASRQMRHVGYEARDLMNESPLILGAAALVIGAMLGAAIPETEKENELMGETRDRLAGRAKEAAREGVEKAKDVATAAAGAMKDAVQEQSSGTGNTGTAGRTTAASPGTSAQSGTSSGPASPASRTNSATGSTGSTASGTTGSTGSELGNRTR